MFENMDAEWKAKWVAALRSGEYEQGVGNLMAPVGFCCLGVLCNIFNPDGWDSDMSGASYSYDYSGDENDPSHDDKSDHWEETHSDTELPDSLSAHLGIDNDDEQTLIAFNDGVNGVRNPLGIHLTFNEIADIIEFGVLPNKAIA